MKSIFFVVLYNILRAGVELKFISYEKGKNTCEISQIDA